MKSKFPERRELQSLLRKLEALCDELLLMLLSGNENTDLKTKDNDGQTHAVQCETIKPRNLCHLREQKASTIEPKQFSVINQGQQLLLC